MTALAEPVPEIETIEQVRKALNWSLEQLAKRTGYSKRTLERVISGELKFSDRLKKMLREIMEDEKAMRDASRIQESQPRFAPSSKPAVKNPPMVSDVNYESAGEERDYLADVLREISQECDVAQLEKMLLRVARSKALKSPAREEAMERLSAEIRAKSKT